jgi:DNA-binding response OmpR family regulator
MPPERLLVADDDEGFCASVRALLEGAGYAVEVVSSGDAALAAARLSPPAAVLLEVNLPGLSGYEVCRALKQDLGSSVAVLFVSGERTESFDRVAGLLIGADDYLTKPFAPDELLARVRALLRRSSAPGLRGAGLSHRELEVLALLAEGLRQAEIAQRLVISPKTVAKHIERILGKLDAHSRAQAVAIAYRLQLVPIPA